MNAGVRENPPVDSQEVRATSNRPEDSADPAEDSNDPPVDPLDDDVDMSGPEPSQEASDHWRMVAEARAAENAALQANAQLQQDKAVLLQQLVDALKTGQTPASEESMVQSSTSDANKQAVKHQLQAMLNAHTRFDGIKPTTDKVEDFLHQVATYQERAQLEDHNLIFHFQSMLDKQAACWWKQNMKPLLPELPVDADGNKYRAVVAEFTKEFLPKLYKVEQRNKFHKLELEGDNLLGFIEKFRAAVFRLPDMPESEKWHSLFGKITEPMRNVLRIQGITLDQGDTAKALAALHTHAKGLQQDRRKERTVAVHSAKRHADSAHAPRGPPEKRTKKSTKFTAEERARAEKVVVTKDNCGNFKKIPFLTKNLREFLRDNNGCFYCRMLNKPAGHTEDSCAKQARASGRKDF